MAAITEKRGRPRYIAEVDLKQDPAQFYYDKFYQACHSFSYRDIMALSRALGLNPRSVYAWRYGEKFPRSIGTALVVIDWAAAGKPMRLQRQAERVEKDANWN